LNAARVAALGALGLAILVVGVVLLKGSDVHTYSLRFENAGQLVKDDDVQVGGRRVGSIREIKLTDDNQARLKIEVQEPYAPLREGTLAKIRATSLSGVANRYISLTPGAANAKALDDGAEVMADKSQSIVDLDQLFNTLDPKTRKSLQGVIQGFDTQLKGKGDEANESAQYFSPFLSTSRRLVNEVTEDEPALTQFLVNSSRAVTALAEKKQQLTELISNSNTTAQAIGSENVALARALGVLPTTLRRANTTFVNLRATLGDLDVLVAESKPATKDLARFLRALRPLVADARPTIRDLRRLVTRQGPDNDLTDATRKLPGLERVATPAFAANTQALKQSQPVLETIRPYTPDIVGWFRDFGFNASAYDANGHYARIQPIFNAFSVGTNPLGGEEVLTPTSPGTRLTGLQNGFADRCPGAAIYQAEDKSNPFTDEGRLGPTPDDCNPAKQVPGP
jgi:phospholipid/cholesterol/gamma-HCH transport system substrate-binding protein